MPQIAQSRILIMATDGFEQSELKEPLRQLKQAGASVHVAAPEPGSIIGWNEKDWGEQVPVDRAISDIDASEYDALVLPCGQMEAILVETDDQSRMPSFGKIAVAAMVGNEDAPTMSRRSCSRPATMLATPSPPPA